MRELGINIEEAAIMSAVTPVVAIIMPPIAGVIADKIGNFKVISIFFAMILTVLDILNSIDFQTSQNYDNFL